MSDEPKISCEDLEVRLSELGKIHKGETVTFDDYNSVYLLVDEAYFECDEHDEECQDKHIIDVFTIREAKSLMQRSDD